MLFGEDVSSDMGFAFSSGVMRGERGSCGFVRLKKGLPRKVMESFSPVGGVGGAWSIVDAKLLWVFMPAAAWP